MTKKALVIGCMALISAVYVSSGQTSRTQSSNSESASISTQRALLDQYCVTCHNQKQNTAGLNLEKLDLARVHDNPEVWEKVIHKIRAGMQPPSGKPRPDAATLEAFVVWLENEIDRNASHQFPAPGLHRVNRVEYTNVIRQLLALEIDATKLLPPDDSTRGFDNMAAALGLSPALLEAYVSAAGKISRLAIGDVKAPIQTLYRVREDLTQNYQIEGLPFGTRGGSLIRHEFPADGEYTIKVAAVNRGLMGGAQAFGEVKGEQLEVLLDGARLGVFDWDKAVTPARGGGQPGTVDVRFTTKAGLHTVGATFLATHYAPLLDLNNPFERSTIETGGLPGFTFFPHVGSVRIDGPYNAAGATDTAARRKIFVCHPTSKASGAGGTSEEDACAKKIISTLASQAFRQPAATDDVQEIMGLYQSGRKNGTFDQGIEMALQGILAHPKFIYRFESEPGNVATDQTYRSAIWNSHPDCRSSSGVRVRMMN